MAGVAYRDLECLTQTICKALVHQTGRLQGAEFRYLRLRLRLSQKALAKLLGNSEQSAVNWKKSGRVLLWPDKHIRILWQAAQQGDETVKQVVRRLNDVARLLNQRIVVEETAKGWRSRVEDGVPAR
jgi:transcriptional regulator with XRE-family HTH domain